MILLQYLVVRLSLVLAVVGIYLRESKSIVLAIEEQVIGSHGSISNDGESGGTSVDDTEAPLTGSGCELDDVFLV